MSRPATRGGHGVLGPRTVAAFVVGALLGGALVAPVLPEAVGSEVAALMTGGGMVIAVSVGALAVLMVLLLLFYQLTVS